jgi:hypothetical protein
MCIKTKVLILFYEIYLYTTFSIYIKNRKNLQEYT